MEISRINYLRSALDGENIDLVELSEVEEAFRQIPDSELSEARENATASDMLDELARRVSPIEQELYNFVYDEFGESEANDPAYSLGAAAKRLEVMPVKIDGKVVRLGDLL